MRSRMRKLIVLSAFAALLCALAGSAMAENIAMMESGGTGTCTIDSSPVITTILSRPGTFDGKTYGTWSFLAQDGTGSMDVYGGSLTGLNYTPAVGDAINVSGTYSPFHQLPELQTLTAISAVSSGNAVPPPTPATISEINGTTEPENRAGYYLELDNVQISGISGTFGIANLTGTITDQGGNSMTLYYWPTSYSVPVANLGGTAIPTGLVNMTGFVSVYTTPGSTGEFTPMTITAAVPEPATLALLAAGGVCALALHCLRRRSR